MRAVKLHQSADAPKNYTLIVDTDFVVRLSQNSKFHLLFGPRLELANQEFLAKRDRFSIKATDRQYLLGFHLGLGVYLNDFALFRYKIGFNRPVRYYQSLNINGKKSEISQDGPTVPLPFAGIAFYSSVLSKKFYFGFFTEYGFNLVGEGGRIGYPQYPFRIGLSFLYSPKD